MKKEPCPGGKPDVDIVVPVLNEKDSIAEFYSRVGKTGYGDCLIFVDNASSDGTAEWISAQPSIRLIRHRRNQGYGASIRDGIAASRSGKVVIMDADLEYPPEVIPELLATLEDHPVVYGSRFLSGSPPEMPRMRLIGNRIISAVFNFLFRQHTTDFYTGIKGLTREAVDCLDLRRDGFEQVVEMGAKLSHAGYTIHEIPVAYRLRSHGASKMRHLPETLKYLWYVSIYRLGLGSRRRARSAGGI